MMLELLMPIHDRLRKLRSEADLTQQALAERAGLSMSAVIHIERGRIPDPRISTLRALAKALGVSLDELAGEDDDPPAEPEPPKRRPKK